MIDELRSRIEELDMRILALIRERMDVAESIGSIKTALDIPIRNDSVEAAVVERYRDFATDNALDPDALESICRILIEESKRLQKMK